MEVERALVAAICAAPDDDAPRLVYADWLIEHGHPRGELIVLGCELARLAPRDPRRWVLSRRIAEATRVAGLGPLVRGFPIELSLRARDLPELPARLAEAPYRRLELTHWTNRGLPELFEKGLGIVDQLSLISTSLFRGATIDAFAAWPEVARLRRFALAAEISGDDYLRLFALARFPALETLALDGLWHAPATADRDALDKLKRLELRRTRFEAASGWLPRLEALDLDQGWDGLGTELAAHATALRELRMVGASRSRLAIGDAGIAALAPLPLVELAVEWGNVRDAGVEAFVAAGGLRALITLRLARNEIGDRGARAIAASPDARGLRELHLDGNRIFDSGVRALVDSPHLDDLGMLVLYSNPFSADAAAALGDRFGERVVLSDWP